MWLSKPPAGIQLNRNHPLAQGLVGCWLFNEGAGLRANDLSGNNNTGVLTNFEPFTSTRGWIGTNQGTALNFDGVNSYVDCGNNPILNSFKEITMESRIKTTNSATIQMIIERHNAASTQGYNILTLNATGNLSGRLYPNAINSTTSITDGKYHHCVMTNQGVGGNWILYLDGVPIVTHAGVVYTPVTTGTDTFIGARDGGLPPQLPFSGIINYVRIWNRALNATEIQNLYAQPYAMFRNQSEQTRKSYDNEILV